jgi:hypothetical protein
MKEIIARKRQTLICTVDRTVTTVQEFTDQLDNSYDECIGVAMYVPSSDQAFQASVMDNDQTYQNMTYSQDYIPSTSVPKKDRYTPMNIKVQSGNKIKVQIQRITVGVATDLVHVVFDLVKYSNKST